MGNNFNLPQNNKKRIVIIGAGFAGLKMARILSGSEYQVLLIDKRNFHQFQPLFYQVATSGIEPALISFPVRKVFHNYKNLHYRNLELKEILSESNEIVTDSGNISYDYLILATGVNTNYFGNENITRYSIPMKSTAEAINLRNRILKSYESAILTEDIEEQSKLLTFSIVGGGPTGVELAGAIAELKNYVLPKDYPELDFSRMKIQLFEASPRLLGGMRDKSALDAGRFLSRLGVELHLNTRIDDYDGETVLLSDGSNFKSQNLIWTAGVIGKSFQGLNDMDYAHGKRLKVDRQNKLINYENIYAVGDISLMKTEKYPEGHPQVAQVAIQQGKLLAKNLKAKKRRAFEYKDMGSMATIGRNMAVCDLPGMRFSGRFAWFLWLFVHLMSIVGVKNRFFIFVNWAQSYVLRDQSLRILIRPFQKKTG
jgi:NADH dehydrogenase